MTLSPDFTGAQVAERDLRVDKGVACHHAEAIASARGYIAEVDDVDRQQGAWRPGRLCFSVLRCKGRSDSSGFLLQGFAPNALERFPVLGLGGVLLTGHGEHDRLGRVRPDLHGFCIIVFLDSGCASSQERSEHHGESYLMCEPHWLSSPDLTLGCSLSRPR